jgi:hypothetical protein
VLGLQSSTSIGVATVSVSVPEFEPDAIFEEHGLEGVGIMEERMYCTQLSRLPIIGIHMCMELSICMHDGKICIPLIPKPATRRVNCCC